MSMDGFSKIPACTINVFSVTKMNKRWVSYECSISF